MLEKYKPGITLFSILTFIAILFPPVIWEYKSKVFDKGLSFLLSVPNYVFPNGRKSNIGGTINFPQLFLEILIILVVSVLFQVYYEKIKNFLKNS